MELSKWLNNKFLEWEQASGKRQTITAFAEYLEIPYSSLQTWLGGNYAPRGKNLAKVAEKLGFEVYDLMGLPIPLPEELDKDAVKLAKVMMEFPAELRPVIREANMRIIEKLTKSKDTNKTEDEMLAELVSEMQKIIQEKKTKSK